MTEEAAGYGEPTYEGLDDRERDFVKEVAKHFHEADGMPMDQSAVVGYLIVCHPPKQSVDQVAAAIGVDPRAVVELVDRLAPAGLFKRTYTGNGDEFLVSLENEAWPSVAIHAFSALPVFHEIVAKGLAQFEGESEDRLERLRGLDALYGWLAQEIPPMLERYEEFRRERLG